jgi:hypothetical protein
MDTTALEQKDLGELLGIAELEPAAQEDMLARIGELVMESAMVRAVSEMTPLSLQKCFKNVCRT